MSRTEFMQGNAACAEGALAASRMTLKGVYFEDLGMAEAVWVIEADNLPLTVGIDAHGGDLFRAVRENAKTQFHQRFNIKQDTVS